MEIRTLKYFLAVAREENMTRAAEQLHVTQPTLSKALKSLEDELDKKLFTRHSFSIRLTDEGVLLRDRAEDLVSMADKIEKEFLSLDDITGGELFLGLAESYRIEYVANAIKALKERYPKLQYHIISGDTEQVADKLQKGLLDFVVLAEDPDPRKYDFVPFPESDVWGLVFPADDPLAAKNQISLSDLIGLPLFCSEQAWIHELKAWAGNKYDTQHLLQLKYKVLNGLSLVMPAVGFGPIIGITKPQHHNGDHMLRQAEGVHYGLGIEASDPDGVNAELLRFIHHGGRRDGGVLLAGIVIPIIPVTRIRPDLTHIVAHEDHQRHVVVEMRDGLQLFQPFLAADQVKLLRLIIAGGGHNAPSLQNLIQLLLLYGTAVKEPLGISVFCKLQKIHIFHAPYAK